jgi:alpha 1,2-mannosyltransferase
VYTNLFFGSVSSVSLVFFNIWISVAPPPILRGRHLLESMQFPSTTGSWLARGLVASIVLCELVLVVVWSDTQTFNASGAQQLQLLQTDAAQNASTDSEMGNLTLSREGSDSPTGVQDASPRAESNNTTQVLAHEASASLDGVRADIPGPTKAQVVSNLTIAGSFGGTNGEHEAAAGETGLNSTRDSSAVNGTKLSPKVPAYQLLQIFLESNGPSTLGIPQFTCLGWHQTGGCSPDGPREPENDVGCSTNIKAGASGYCLVRDEATGAELQVMRMTCSSLRNEVTFNCRQSTDFARVAPQIDALIEAKRREETNTHHQEEEVVFESKKGIVMVMYPSVLPSVYATIRLLRSYACTLHIELWSLESEMGSNPLEESSLLKALVNEHGPISLHNITEEDVASFNTKVFALAHSKLDQVLFLDADNAPVKDPTYLFSSPEFEKTGAIFWPDFWHPNCTIFNINAGSLLWELVDLPFTDMFEQESGQLLIDRRRAALALGVVQLLALRDPNHFERLKLLHGDKDLFRLAWLKTNTTFHMISTPPAAAGMVNSGQFCGMTMAQHDTEGAVLFLHHNGKKLIAEDAGTKTRVWTHLQSFVFPDSLASVNSNAAGRYEYLATNYRVKIVGASTEFPELPMCYGMKSGYSRLTPWEDLPWRQIEAQLRDFAREASLLGK